MIPEVTLGWRLRMSLGHMPVSEMAEQLGVSRATVSRWMADKGHAPRRIYIERWAEITEADLGWLIGDEGRGGVRPVPRPVHAHYRRMAFA